VPTPLSTLRGLTKAERVKASLLSAWFFLMITTLWLLKPVRSASLLAHLGASELPQVRLGAVVVVAAVVAGYSRIVGRRSRLYVAAGASLLFSAILMLFWASLEVGGPVLGAQRWFVWSVFILVDVYSTVMIGIFWTYANDVVSPDEADRLYGPVGVGGILGGVAGGVIVDSLVRLTGPVHLLLICAVLGVLCALLVRFTEHLLHPRPRPLSRDERGLAAATQGAREVFRSRYLLLIVGVVVGYEFAAAMTDFVVSVVFERAFTDEVELAKMFGRVGWIVSATALVSQLVLVPILLPRKRFALLLSPIAMGLGTILLAVAPIVSIAIVMSAADRGLNYSLQQATKETLYVPLNDVQRYKGKAFIDMLVDRFGKALSAIALMLVIRAAGMSISVSLAIALAAVALWAFSAGSLGHAYAAQRALAEERTNAAREGATSPSLATGTKREPIPRITTQEGPAS
jgi:AAA family ATP:ADP antiporter